MGCLICERIGQIERGENPYFVCALSTGYVVLGDHQRFQGYTLFLCKRHVTELYQLPWGFRTRFLQEMSLVAEAVAAVYHPEKMNYELLGNGDTHLHWHLFPRVSGDTPQPGPVWWLPREEMWNDAYRPSREQLAERTRQLREEIERRLCTLPPLMPGEEEQDVSIKVSFVDLNRRPSCRGRRSRMDRRPIGTKKLPAAFYLQDTVEVARQLIGKRLVHRVNGQELSAIICETEAYTGFSDKACHSYKGRTERTEVMFEAGGRAYVYLIYGMYCCFNITTREAGVPEAVLIRAACPLEGIETMRALRQQKKPVKSLNEKNLLSGPGRLCAGMGLGREHNGLVLTGEELYLCEGIAVPPEQIAATRRINIDYAQEARDFLYRFVDTKSPCLSQKWKGETR